MLYCPDIGILIYCHLLLISKYLSKVTSPLPVIVEFVINEPAGPEEAGESEVNEPSTSKIPLIVMALPSLKITSEEGLIVTASKSI